MAGTVNLCRMVAVCSCLALTYGTCSKDCALCIYRHEQGERTKASSLSCAVECERSVDKQKLEMCREVLMEENITSASSLRGTEGEDQHQLAKKYGGFMKHYGDYIMKNPANVEDDTGAHFDEEATKLISKRYGGFMKKDTAAQHESREARKLQALKEILRVGIRDAHYGEGSKHSTGFMRDPKENQEDSVRDLQKRYGGFMRRVGRPEWLDDHKGYGQLAKRFLLETAETSVPSMEKRYGGFMD